MSQDFKPNNNYMIITFRELEIALEVMANPNRRHLISDTISTIQALNSTEGPSRALMTLVGSVAWLTEEPGDGGPRELLNGQTGSSAFVKGRPSESSS